ncbi:hypothetical protein ACLBYG_22360 [Methylobacterium sp. D53M]
MPTGPTAPPVGANDLTTLAAAYGYLGIAPGSDDTGLQRAITAVSQRIATWCSRTFQATDFVERYNGMGTPDIVLRNYPVIAISALAVFGSQIHESVNALGAGYVHDGRRTVSLVGDRFPRAAQAVTISYRAGYETPPADLELACLEWMKAGYLSQSRPSDLVSQRAGDHEERYSSAGAVTQLGTHTVPMPASVYAVLSQYKNVVPV